MRPTTELVREGSGSARPRRPGFPRNQAPEDPVAVAPRLGPSSIGAASRRAQRTRAACASRVSRRSRRSTVVVSAIDSALIDRHRTATPEDVPSTHPGGRHRPRSSEQDVARRRRRRRRVWPGARRWRHLASSQARDQRMSRRGARYQEDQDHLAGSNWTPGRPRHGRGVQAPSPAGAIDIASPQRPIAVPMPANDAALPPLHVDSLGCAARSSRSRRWQVASSRPR